MHWNIYYERVTRQNGDLNIQGCRHPPLYVSLRKRWEKTLTVLFLVLMLNCKGGKPCIKFRHLWQPSIVTSSVAIARYSLVFTRLLTMRTPTCRQHACSFLQIHASCFLSVWQLEIQVRSNIRSWILFDLQNILEGRRKYTISMT